MSRCSGFCELREAKDACIGDAQQKSKRSWDCVIIFYMKDIFKTIIYVFSVCLFSFFTYTLLFTGQQCATLGLNLSKTFPSMCWFENYSYFLIPIPLLVLLSLSYIDKLNWLKIVLYILIAFSLAYPLLYGLLFSLAS